MLSSKPPPYDPALVAEARESAEKIEGGLWTKSSSAADYESRARKKLEAISGQIQRSGTPGETQRAHYQAAMIAQGFLYERAVPATLPPPQDNAQLAATLDLFDRKLQSSGAGPGPLQASQASQASSSRPAVGPTVHRIVRAIVERYVDKAECKAFLLTLPMDQRRAYLVKLAYFGKRALAQYRQQQQASGSKSKGLGEVALAEHLTGVVMKMMAKADGAGAGAVGLGLHHQQQLRQREEEARRGAAAREKLERERAEHERARRDGAVGGSNSGGSRGGVGGVMEMAAYWTRLGLMRGAYLPRAKQTMELLKKKARSSADDSAQKKNAERFLQWMSEYLVPMLSQTAEAPCASAKFSMDELERLDAQMKKLVTMTSGRGAAAQGSAAGDGAVNSAAPTGGGPAVSGGLAESSFTSESADAPNGSERQKRDAVSERDRTAMAEKEARAAADARRKAAEARSARPSAFARVTSGDDTAGTSLPPVPFALERFPPPKTPGKPSEVHSDDSAPPAVFVDPARANEAVAMRFLNGGRELVRLALETKANASDSTPASVWKSWDELMK